MENDDLAARITEIRESLGSKLLILGHHYQQDEVIEHADLRGDSYQLSQMAAESSDCRQIVFCGVHFMAETADMLANRPEKLAERDGQRVTVILPDQPDRTYFRGVVQANDGFLGDVPADLLAEPTVPAGHPEAFHDAFARLHRFFEADVRAYQAGKPFSCDGSNYANVDDGRMGIAFISAAVESSDSGGTPVKVNLK